MIPVTSSWASRLARNSFFMITLLGCLDFLLRPAPSELLTHGRNVDRAARALSGFDRVKRITSLASKNHGSAGAPTLRKGRIAGIGRLPDLAQGKSLGGFRGMQSRKGFSQSLKCRGVMCANHCTKISGI